MKKQVAVLALAATMMLQSGAAVFAEDGPMTSESPTAMHIITLPFRLVTGAAGLGIGAVVGGAKGIVDTEKQFADHTYAKADENPLLVPVGLVGSVVAVPVGFLKGAPQGAADMGRAGYSLWDRL